MQLALVHSVPFRMRHSGCVHMGKCLRLIVPPSRTLLPQMLSQPVRQPWNLPHANSTCKCWTLVTSRICLALLLVVVVASASCSSSPLCPAAIKSTTPFQYSDWSCAGSFWWSKSYCCHASCDTLLLCPWRCYQARASYSPRALRRCESAKHVCSRPALSAINGGCRSEGTNRKGPQGRNE